MLYGHPRMPWRSSAYGDMVYGCLWMSILAGWKPDRFWCVFGLCWGWGGVGCGDVNVRVHFQSQWMLRCALREVDDTLPAVLYADPSIRSGNWSKMLFLQVYTPLRLCWCCTSDNEWRWMSASTDLFTKIGKRLYKDAFWTQRKNNSDAVHGIFPQWQDGFHMEWEWKHW